MKIFQFTIIVAILSENTQLTSENEDTVAAAAPSESITLKTRDQMMNEVPPSIKSRNLK